MADESETSSEQSPGEFRDRLPDELIAITHSEEYSFPDNSRRRIPGILYLVLGVSVLVVRAVFGGGGPHVNSGVIVGAGLLILIGVLSISSGWRMHVDEQQALAAAGRALGFAIGHASACGAAVAVGAGYLALGLLLVILAALPDLLDGALAKASNTSSQRGAFFDSVVDRVTDSLLLGGVAWYLVGRESPYIALVPFAVAAMSSVISYERAKLRRSRRQSRRIARQGRRLNARRTLRR